MQGERVKVLVEPSKDSFEVPYDLLEQYSTAFEKLRNALNDSGDEIILQDVGKSTFQDFFIWLHTYEPSITYSEPVDSDSVNGALELAVFAEKYKIFHLRNQASDVIRVALLDGQWKITPEMISAVYKVAPAGSALRQLSFLGFVAAVPAEGQIDSNLWQPAFIQCPELGFDYFHYKSGSMVEGVESGGACRFHNHRDIDSWVVEDVVACSYSYGAARVMPKEDAEPKIAPVAVIRNERPKGSLAAPNIQGQALTQDSASNNPQPESVEDQPPEETIVEPSVTEHSEIGWKSETTETEQVEQEPGRFQPANKSLPEEGPVEAWVTETQQMPPLEVEYIEASSSQRKASLVAGGNAMMSMVEETEELQPVEEKTQVKVTSVVTEKPVLEKEIPFKAISIVKENPVTEKKVPAVKTQSITQEEKPVEKLPLVPEEEPSVEPSTNMQRTQSVDPQNNSGKKKKKNKNKAK
jgi:hypothetical protein